MERRDLPKTLYFSSIAVLAAYLALAPLAGHLITPNFLLLQLMALAISFNIIAGYVRYVSFGHVAFFGIGAYVTAILVWKLGLPPLLCVFVGGVGATLAALVVGIPTLRLRGTYFAIATIALNEAIKGSILILPDSVAGGSHGIPQPSIYAPLASYYALLGVTIGALVVMHFLVSSRMGLRFRSIGEDEEAASAMGINTVGVKLLGFMISAFLAGLVGGMNFWYTTYVEPVSAFNLRISIGMMATALLGGLGTLFGPLLGAVILYPVEQVLWVSFPEVYLMVLGAAIAIFVVFLPRGIMGYIRSKFSEFRAFIL
ncbi:MAG: branched-chain amino acid ABC transporter permease [Thermoplasmata archaeon]